MEVSSGAEEGFVREWTPCSHIMNLIPPKITTSWGLFSSEISLTCVDTVSEYIALGTIVGIVYWYDRKKGNIQRLPCEATNTSITYVKIVNTVDYMVGAGNAAGQVTIFQIPKEHPENIPDTFKPKVEPKVERYTIGYIHNSKITAIEWSKNGMRLFSGDEKGVIVMTEIDFYMHFCKSMQIVNEGHEIVQMSYYQNTLLVSSVYRSIVCERRDSKWHVNQIGKKERKSLCALGAVFQYSYACGGAVQAYCARPGMRLWRADKQGDVLQTLLFKEAISNPLTVVELLNPSQSKHSHSDQEYNLGPLFVFREHFIVSHNEHMLYILDPRSLTAVAVVEDLRRILSVSVNKDEIFILEGPRSLVRLAHSPEPAGLATEEPTNLMTKSLTTSIQQAVNTVRDLTHINQTVPYITSVLEQSMFTRHEEATVASAEECFELPPIKTLPVDLSENVLESIVNEFRDVTSDAEEFRLAKSEELQRKLKLYNSIMEKKCDEELIHSSRRSRRRDGSGGSTPRMPTPVRKLDNVNYTTPCVMDLSVYSDAPEQNDEYLEKEIEEKEKILAKMLNLESLSIKSVKIEQEIEESPRIPEQNQEIPDAAPKIIDGFPMYKHIYVQRDEPKADNKIVTTVKDPNLADLVPKVVKMPNNWNLEDIELKLDIKSGFKDRVMSPDDHLDSEWEIV